MSQIQFSELEQYATNKAYIIGCNEIKERKLYERSHQCCWHACPIHFPNNKKRNNDNSRIPYLTKCGYKVEIIWEHDIMNRLEEVISSLCLKYDLKN
jgi:G:T-mismatch repair DNA endonuclease (very short patch repair protein)